MSLYRSRAYQRIHDETWEQYRPNGEELKLRKNDRYWLRAMAPKWVSRVGMPRLVAEAVLAEAFGLVRSINPGLFRNDPEMLVMFRNVRDALEHFYSEFARQNWQRYMEKEKR